MTPAQIDEANVALDLLIAEEKKEMQKLSRKRK